MIGRAVFEGGARPTRSWAAPHPELDGPSETYDPNGQLYQKGTYNMSERCGEWIEDGETVTYDPCPPDLEDGN